MVFDVFSRGSKTPPKGAPPSSSSAPQGKGKPLHLLQYDESSKKFTLGDEALDCLRAIKGPVGVLSVCGRARQGKSFILNQLAGAGVACNEGGFKVGPTVRPCTKGLWIWSSPILRHTPDGEPYHLILLDTEGIDAYDQTGQYSTQIFSMAVLLSSLFVYNQMGGIDEAALDRLSLVTEMTKHIRVKSDEKGVNGKTKQTTADQTELGKFSPSFVWLLRDFYLDFSDDTEEISPVEYLERALRNVGGVGPGVESKNGIRDSIKSLFPERECFPLVRPVNDEKELRNLDSLSPDKLRPEFKEGLGRLLETLFHRCRPKTVGDDVLNGASLAGMAQTYVAAINGGAVPAIATAWQSVAEGECRKAGALGSEAWASVFFPGVDACGADELSITQAHERAVRSAGAAFDANAVGGFLSGPRTAARAAMTQNLDKRRREYVTKRFAEAAALCASRLAQAGVRVRAVADAPDATVADVVAAADAEAAAIDADATTLGPGRHEQLTHWLRDIAESTVGGLARLAAERLTRELRVATERAARETCAAQAAAERVAVSEKRADDALHRVTACAERASAATRDAADANARAAAVSCNAEAKLSIRDAELSSAKRDTERAHAEVAQLKQALELEKSRCREVSEHRTAAEREVVELKRDGAAARANGVAAASAIGTDLQKTKAQLAHAERSLEHAQSAAADATARASLEVSQARAVAATGVAAAEAAAAEAKRSASDAEKRAKIAETEVERLKGGKHYADGNTDQGDDEFHDAGARDDDETLERWRDEAAAAAAAVAPVAAADLGSPGKRRRDDAHTGGGMGGTRAGGVTAGDRTRARVVDGVDAVEAAAGEDAEETCEADAKKRQEAESMTVAQLKHELQVMGLAHLYVGQRGIKKGDLVGMFVNGD